MFGVPDAALNTNKEFPAVGACHLRRRLGCCSRPTGAGTAQRKTLSTVFAACWTMPHTIHAIVAVFSSLLFLAGTGLFCMGSMELNFLTVDTSAVMQTQ